MSPAGTARRERAPKIVGRTGTASDGKVRVDAADASVAVTEIADQVHANA